MNEKEYELFLDTCRKELKAKIAAMQHQWNLPSYPRFDFDQDKGQLIFSGAMSSVVLCEIQVVGSFSIKELTWEWAWNNPYIEDKLKIDSLALKDFGAKHGIQRLTTPNWPATEDDSWDMTAIGAHTCSASGAYRAPVGNIMIFMLIKQMTAGSKPGNH
jgi:hypothetical protein